MDGDRLVARLCQYVVLILSDVHTSKITIGPIEDYDLVLFFSFSTCQRGLRQPRESREEAAARGQKHSSASMARSVGMSDQVQQLLHRYPAETSQAIELSVPLQTFHYRSGQLNLRCVVKIAGVYEQCGASFSWAPVLGNPCRNETVKLEFSICFKNLRTNRNQQILQFPRVYTQRLPFGKIFENAGTRCARAGQREYAKKTDKAENFLQSVQRLKLDSSWLSKTTRCHSVKLFSLQLFLRELVLFSEQQQQQQPPPPLAYRESVQACSLNGGVSMQRGTLWRAREFDSIAKFAKRYNVCTPSYWHGAVQNIRECLRIALRSCVQYCHDRKFYQLNEPSSLGNFVHALDGE
ncbi:unnamed protein product [Trichogramma brassicae]|uniref:Uncharacterized protein n=1 Tax=Trichogramma brassicae TaxID=86971 RepID=A0A6H5J3U6_9HYME|nr:unnamed protein product [Trichogramma brassicae]